MRQAGILAAAGLYALDHVLPRIPLDHARARAFASRLASIEGVDIDAGRVRTNLVAFRIPALSDAEIMVGCAERGLRIAPIKTGTMRAVFHHQIGDDAVETAASIIADVVAASR